MENNQGPNGPVALGPRRGGRLPAGQALSSSRAAILEMIADQPVPTTLAALVDATGLHPNTVREHLEGLEKRGLVRRHRAAPSGRGRPAWLYEATGDAESEPRSEYAGLAATLASVISRTSSSPREDAIRAGTDWGHELARDHARANGHRGVPRLRGAAARVQVVELLEDIGFGPRSDAASSVVMLTRCPLLEAAHRYPDVVCGVHLGIVRGALEEYGAGTSASELFPFSEPGACRLELRVKPGSEHS